MNWLEAQIKERMERAAEDVLAGTKDTFDMAVARYRVLKDLLNDLADHRKNAKPGDDPSDD